MSSVVEKVCARCKSTYTFNLTGICDYCNGSKVKGVGQDTPIVENERGGRQSAVSYRLDLLDPKAMFSIGKVLHEGAIKYGDDNWKNIITREHINHALVHIYAYLAGDTQDEHLEHAFCRMMMAVAVEGTHEPTISQPSSV